MWPEAGPPGALPHGRFLGSHPLWAESNAELFTEDLV